MLQPDSRPLIATDRLLATDRGDLWLASRGGKERSLIRLVDKRLADREFRSAVLDLRSVLANHPMPRVLPIVDDNFHGDQYYIEYRLDWRAQSVPQFFAQSRWLERLRFLRDTTGVYDQWRQHMPLPLGLHGGGMIACRVNNQWVAHLAPCPQIPLASPYELIRTDPSVLAAIAPERLRGVSFSGIMEDVYAAGALAPQALGIQTFAGGAGPEERIEAQARAALNACDFERSNVEKSLWSISIIRDCLTELSGVILRCAAFSPDARPPDLRELQIALDRVLALDDATAFARQLENRQRPGEALQFFEWALTNGAIREEEEHRVRSLAADLAKQLQMPARELYYLQGVTGDAARRRRLEIQYDQYLKNVTTGPTGADPEGDHILAELERLRPVSMRDLDREERIQAKEDRLRAAMIHLRRSDLYRRAQELWAITELDFKDIDALFLYGLSLSDLKAPADTINQLIDEAGRRLKKLKEAEILDAEEVTTWTERFQALRHR